MRVLFALSTDQGRASSALGCAIALGGIVAAWRRADPLAPVDHVERILHLAVDAGWTLAFLAFSSLVLLIAPMLAFAFGSSRSPVRVLAATLAAYTVTGIAATELGHFPVPVMGAGAGPVLGWYGAVAVLVATLSSTPSSSRRIAVTSDVTSRTRSRSRSSGSGP